MTERTISEQLAIDASEGRTGPLRWRGRDEVPEDQQEILTVTVHDRMPQSGWYSKRWECVFRDGHDNEDKWQDIRHWLPASELADTLPTDGGEA